MLAIIWQFWNIIERWISTSLGTSVESFATYNIWFIVYHASESIQLEWREKFNRYSRPPILKSLFYVNSFLGKQKKRVRNLLWIFLENLAHICNSWLKVDNVLRSFFLIRFQSRPWNSTTFFLCQPSHFGNKNIWSDTKSMTSIPVSVAKLCT